MFPSIIEVTAALVQHNNRILIAQRPAVHRFANKWEFPGGKIDPGETPEQGLQRELREELGIETRIGALFSETLYTHEQGQIRQFTFWVEMIGNPDTICVEEHQAIAWVTPSEIQQYEFAGADLAVVKLLQEQ